eukprot:CAMPEP_0178548962 /NCGR_PEP_ID=MMETSP0697-20121206/5480_1 /TAXON_ID=265572 /ORGANISM="Extubocellulus spinifer, Strain CCMP396" /LENGTH=69 /DNA_ID=CAMNT_0020181681 /DNA_START=447 /DNA_END=656 /DNA_ORIENTATION=+
MAAQEEEQKDQLIVDTNNTSTILPTTGTACVFASIPSTIVVNGDDNDCDYELVEALHERSFFGSEYVHE